MHSSSALTLGVVSRSTSMLFEARSASRVKIWGME
jgi:hypothetical protein